MRKELEDLVNWIELQRHTNGYFLASTDEVEEQARLNKIMEAAKRALALDDVRQSKLPRGGFF